MEKLFKPRILNSLTQSWKIWAMGHINIFHKPCTDPGDSSLDCHSTAASAQLSVFFQQSCTPPIDTMWSHTFALSTVEQCLSVGTEKFALPSEPSSNCLFKSHKKTCDNF